MSLLETILFGTVVLVTHFMEGITGFGCTVLALPFCIALAGINVAVPVLIVLAWVLCLYIVVIDHKNIILKEYIRIVGLLILGLPIGMWLFTSLPEGILKKLLGIFMIMVAIRGLYITFLSKPEEAGKEDGIKNTSKTKKYLLNVVLFLGGIIHGAFSSGGPFVIIYAAQALPNKSNFRATLCAVWLTLNSIMIINNVRQGIMTEPTLQLILWTLPFLVTGMLLGNYAHNNINGDVFKKLVYVVLLLSGAFMLR